MIGLDSVDDESKPENPLFDRDVTTPDRWTDDENPPYAYYIYYMFANMTILNHFRSEMLSNCKLCPYILGREIVLVPGDGNKREPEMD